MSGPDSIAGDQLAQRAAQGLATEKPKDAVKDLLDQYAIEVSRALPDSWNPERFLRVLQTEVRKNPALMAADRLTLLTSMMQAAQLGLTPGIHGYLIPRKNKKTGKVEVQFQRGYIGTLELIRRTGEIKKVTTAVVREYDEFSVAQGTSPSVIHNPFLGSTQEREWTHVYSIAWFDKETFDFELMDKAQVLKIRDSVYQWQSGPWGSDEEEMARKTVLQRLAKRLPMSDEDRRTLDSEYQTKRVLDPNMLAVPDANAVPVDLFSEDDDQTRAEQRSLADHPAKMRAEPEPDAGEPADAVPDVLADTTLVAWCLSCGTEGEFTCDATPDDLLTCKCPSCGKIGFTSTKPKPPRKKVEPPPQTELST